MKHSLLQGYLQKTPEKEQRSDVLAYLATLDHLKNAAPSIADNILNELKTQRSTLKLIASENYSSLTVQLAMGNLLTDKYCEGFPEHRFYAGCENVDAIELEAEKHAKLLFGTDHAYVQPHSGADANLVAFWAILSARVQTKEMEKLGQSNLMDLSAETFETIRQALCNQTLMGLSLESGGHLTHGFKQNVSAKMFRAITYDVSPSTHLLDYDKIAEIARREKPLILLAGYSAYPRRINFAKMRTIADEVGAVLMVDMAHFAGLVAGKAFQGDENPVPFAHILTSTTHKTLRGPRGGLVLCQQEFTDYVNKGCPYILGGPLPHVIASKAIAFKEALAPDFRTYAAQIITNARALAAGLQKRGISLVTGGTDNHLVLIDLTNLGITGRIAETALTEAGLTVNRNMVPFDLNGAWYTSGIRLGTPALTSLGMGVNEMDEVAEIIALVLNNTSSKIVEKTGQPSKARGQTQESILNEAKRHVHHLLNRFPLYPELTID